MPSHTGRKQLRSTRRAALRLFTLEDRQAPAVFNIANGDVAAFVAAVNTSNTNGESDTINLAPNGNYAFTNFSDTSDGNNALPLLLGDGGHALTVNGSKATITRASGAPTMRFFNVGTADLTLNDVTMTGGVGDTGVTLNSADAGAILVAGGHLTLSDCTLTNNQGLRAAGCIVADIDGTVVNLNRCVFSNNSATDNFSIGGALVLVDSISVTVADCTFDGNKCTDNGGAMFVDSNVALNISGTTISNNSSTGPNFTGGAIFNLGNVTLTNCTLSGNRASSGAAIDNSSGTGTLAINSCTIAGNSAFLDQAYGALLVGGTSVTVHDSIIAGNKFDATVTGGGSPDLATPFSTPLTSMGYNLIGDGTNANISGGTGDLIGTASAVIDAKLGPLQNNGGLTLTQVPNFGSPAIDAGDPAFTTPPNFDQRGMGFPRVSNGRVDIGSVEASLFDLGVTIDDGVTTAVPGQGVTYTITARNLGPGAANGVTVKDMVSNQFSSATWTAVFSSGATGNTSGSGSINEMVDLPVGGMVVYSLAATINPAASGNLISTAQILPPAGGTDITPSNTTATDTDILTPIADVAVTMSSTAGPTAGGKTVHYTINVRNDGPGTAGGAVLTDTFPAAISSATWTSSVTGGATGNTSAGSGNILETLTLPPNATVTYEVDATVSVNAAAGPFTNTATITPPAFGTDPQTDNNTASRTTTVIVGAQVVVVAGDAGQLPIVKVYNSVTGALETSFMAYSASFRGGVRVAVADFNGDGTQDIVTAPGPGGGPHIRVFDGASGRLIREFFAYDASFTGGVYVAAADVNGDGVPDIITGAGPGGGPHVRVFDGKTGQLLGGPIGEFFAYGAGFRGGVRVAAADFNHDGKADIVTAAGPSGGPHVIAWDAATRQPLLSFFAYGADFRGGVYVATGDMNGDGTPDIITGAGEGGGPLVRYFDGHSGLLFRQFYAYPANTGGLGSNSLWSSGVRVAVTSDVDGDSIPDLIVAPGPGRSATIRLDSGAQATQIREFTAFDPSFLGGVFVGGA